MRWRRMLVLTATAGLLCALCSRDNEKVTAPPEKPPLPHDAGPVTMVECSYSFPAPDTIEITIPALTSCDSAGNPVTQQSSSCRAMFRRTVEHGVDHFRAGMVALTPLVKAITSGPSFSSDIGAFLDTLASMDPYIRDSIYGKFVRCSTGVGLGGLWQFDSLGPPILYFFINSDSAMRASVRAMTVDNRGRAVLMFDFDTTRSSLRAMLNRWSYGDNALAMVIDSIAVDVTIRSEYDSIWYVHGDKSGDSASMSVDSLGNLTFTYLGVPPKPSHRYFLHPEPWQCPNSIVAPWWPEFVAANARNP